MVNARNPITDHLDGETVVERTLDEAWAAAEAALPEKWELGIGRIRDEGRWLYWVETGPNLDNEIDGIEKMIGGMDTPAEALLALVAALRGDT